VARAGGLSGQNAISKLLGNHKLGPSVETFVKAVKGLGKDLTMFFAEIEGHDLKTPSTELALHDRLRELERTLNAHLATAGTESETRALLPRPHGRSPHVDSSLSGPGIVHPTTIGLGVHHFEALVTAHLDLLRHHVEGLANRLAQDLKTDRDAHRRPARARARARSRPRKTA
jgi:hypothetical protein